MLPLARDLARQLSSIYAVALDVGTGTGVLACELPSFAKSIIGIDSSAAMLAYAPKNRVQFLQADIQNPPFIAESFDLVVASFGLNATHPRSTFNAIRHLLCAGGMLLFQEWGGMDEVVFAVQNVLEQYTPPTLEEELAAYAEPFAVWENLLQTPDDYGELLTECGFTEIYTEEYAPVSIPVERDTFLHYQVAWPQAQAIIAAQDDPQPLYEALRDALPTEFEWRPNIIRVQARNL